MMVATARMIVNPYARRNAIIPTSVTVLICLSIAGGVILNASLSALPFSSFVGDHVVVLQSLVTQASTIISKETIVNSFRNQQQPDHPKEQRDHQSKTDTIINSNVDVSSTSNILPLAVEYWRRNISLTSLYQIPSRDPKDLCSCTTPRATPQCCMRILIRAHGMDFDSSFSFEDAILQNENNHLSSIRSFHVGQTMNLSIIRRLYIPDYRTDHRSVIVLRNLYDTFIHGYLECMIAGIHVDDRGNTGVSDGGIFKYNGIMTQTKQKLHRLYSKPPWNVDWEASIKIPVDSSSLASSNNIGGRKTFCHYIANDVEDERTGLQLYIEFVMKHFYNDLLSLWVLSQQMMDVRERILTICTTNSNNNAKMQQQKKVDDALNFYFNDRKPSMKEKWSPHSDHPVDTRDKSSGTSQTELLAVAAALKGFRDARTLQNHVHTLIQELDETYYNGDLSWLESVLPC